MMMNKPVNKIEKLIEELCPLGVEFRALGEVGAIIRGNGLQKKDFVDNGIGCIHYGQIYTYYGIFANETKTFVTEELALRLRKAKKGNLVIATTSENAEDVCKAVAWLGDDEIAISGDAHIFQHNQNPKYVSYFFKTAMFFDQKKKYITGTKVLRVSGKNLAKLKIPIPPLTIQKEIVKILDNFTQLEAELEAELEARKRQYDYYSNQLLMVNDKGLMADGTKVEFRALGEVMTIMRGASPRPIRSFLTNDKEGINWLKIGDVNPSAKYVTKTAQRITQEGANKSRFLNKGDFILSNSMSFGRPYILDINGCIHDGWISMSDFENTFSSDFLYHLLKSNVVQQYWKQKASSGTVQNLNADIVRNTKIPIPSLSKQKEIVAILDKFDALVNDISTGLPAEIAARKKQYEYYRNHLLMFNDKGLME